MLLNDRLTNCKSHSHTARFRREERLKHSFSYLRIDTGTRIRNLYQNGSSAIQLAPQLQYACRIPRATIASTAFIIKFKMTCCN